MAKLTKSIIHLLILFFVACIGAWGICYATSWLEKNQKSIQPKESIKEIKQEADSIDYTCPHCGYNVRLTLKNK